MSVYRHTCTRNMSWKSIYEIWMIYTARLTFVQIKNVTMINKGESDTQHNWSLHINI